VARHRFCPCTHADDSPAEPCLGSRSVNPLAPLRPPDANPPIRPLPPSIPSKSQFFPAHASGHPPHIAFPFIAPPATARPTKQTAPSPATRPILCYKLRWGFLRPMQPGTQCATRFHGKTRRNSESRSTVQGLTIALTASRQIIKLSLIYGKQGFRIFKLRPAQLLLALRSSVENHEKINRKLELLEPHVSRSKQMTSQKSIANFHGLCISDFSFFLFHFLIPPTTLHRSRSFKKYQILFLYTLRSIWPQFPSFRLS
jgi:hypothetical protein